MATHLRAVVDALPLITFRAAAGGMPILLGLFIANRWGLEELAAYTVAMASIAIVSVVADWGATRALPRNLALLAPDRGREFLASATAFRLLLAVVAAVAGLVVLLAGLGDSRLTIYLAILFPLAPLALVTTNAISERIVSANTGAIAVAVVAGVVVTVALVAVGLRLGRGPLLIAAAYVAGKLVEGVVITSGRWWVVAVSTAGLAATAAALWPFSLQMIIGVTYPRLAVFTVEAMTTRGELGVFSVAMALQSALLLLPTSLALVYFPELTRRSQAGDARGVRQIILRYTIVSAVGVALGVAVLALAIEPVGRWFNVPPAFGSLVVVFAALAVLTIFSMILPFLLQARGSEAVAARLSILTLVIGLGFQLAGLAWLGLWGIAVGSGAADLMAIAIFGVTLRRLTRTTFGTQT